MIFTPAVENALIAHGFHLAPWKHQKFVERVFGEAGVSMEFHRGTMRGLIEHNAAKRTLSIVAVQNLQPGNGHFLAAIEVFELIAQDGNLRLQIVQFENTGLAKWFERRPRWSRGINAELGDHAIFNP